MLIIMAMAFFAGAAAQAEPCMARQLLSDIGLQYTKLLNAPTRQQHEAARELDRLLLSGDVKQLSLTLSAEGYGVDPLLLSIVIAQIKQDIEALRAGSRIAPMQASLRGILSLMPADTYCTQPLNAMPTLISGSGSTGHDGPEQMSSKVTTFDHGQSPRGRLLSFSLTDAPSRLAIAIAALIVLLIAAVVRCRHRIFKIFGRRSRLPRRSVTVDFQISWHSGDRISVSSVDISTGGMKIALPSTIHRPLEVGSQIALHLSGQVMWAKVVWSNKFYSGIAFDRRLSYRTFHKIIDET